ncbi:GNAT family N-acetyltransferase [Streptomyces sp. NPDC057543]|uniref:GNAT family N-acetyltransferase n=1 Tax=Streptomyces sp. NPDC057543 TaxID=3346163 RepID=UPI0036940D85
MIDTERLSLRPLQVSDVDAFVDLPADPKVNRFVGACTRQPTWHRLVVIERQWAERGHGLCAVELTRRRPPEPHPVLRSMRTMAAERRPRLLDVASSKLLGGTYSKSAARAYPSWRIH